jgi:hypothetical protein
MKTPLLFFFSMWFCMLNSASDAYAQPGSKTPIIYESRTPNGLWTAPSTWTATQNGVPVPDSYPVSGANNIITINSTVRLNTDYAVGDDDGLLTITPTGTLVDAGGHTLTIGDIRGNSKERLRVQSRSGGNALDLFKISFIKAIGTLAAPIQTSSCVTIANSTVLSAPSSITIGGNLTITQGNTAVEGLDGQGRGTLRVEGSIIATPGAVRNFIAANIFANNTPFDCAAGPLPVELISFSARLEQAQVNLQWATASEMNAASFVVERSSDGKNFSTVATVAAAGTSAVRHDYPATDYGMRNGLNYYRLKQVDLDGTFSYTQVVPVQVGSATSKVEAYGSQGNLNVLVQVLGALQQLRVLDTMGRVLYTETLAAAPTELVKRSIPMAAAETRVYIVQAVTSEGVISKKFATTP